MAAILKVRLYVPLASLSICPDVWPWPEVGPAAGREIESRSGAARSGIEQASTGSWIGFCTGSKLLVAQELKGGVQYRDRRFEGDLEAYRRALQTTKTVYVGNLAFTTREEQLYEARHPTLCCLWRFCTCSTQRLSIHTDTRMQHDVSHASKPALQR
jgi:hypothetical protein